jgi:NAD(P) transhydrogenase subunit alpha
MREGLNISTVPITAAQNSRPMTAWHSGIFRIGIPGILLALLHSNGLAAEASSPTGTAEVSFDFISALFVFMLATFVGMDVIRRVSRLLHTPLMSLTNAISAIAVVGAILVAGPEHPSAIHWMGLVAVVASVTNIVSGFLITDRMLKMFKKKGEPK